MTDNAPSPQDQLQALAAQEDLDVFRICGRLTQATRNEWVGEFLKAHHRSRCLLFLATPGGDPDAAYVMARSLRRNYSHITICVLDRCKSAGTLLALSANEIAMGQLGELGPIDIQVTPKDELVRAGSGLVTFKSLERLQQHLLTSFEHYFLELVNRSGGQITTRTAARISTELAVGLVKPISGQIDPTRLGREQRAMEIISAYASRLGVADFVVDRLTRKYPSHGFVIDYEEAVSFIPGVRGPTKAEWAIAGHVENIVGGVYVLQDMPKSVVCATPRPEKEEEPDAGADRDREGDHQSTAEGARTPPDEGEEVSGAEEAVGGDAKGDPE